MEGSLWKEKDFLSSGVRKSFCSGSVPHTKCVGFSLERKGLPFTRCEEVLLFWQRSSHQVQRVSFYKKGLSFTRCEEILLFWKNSLHQVWRDLFRKKRSSFHHVWRNPFILAEFTTLGVERSLYKQEDFLSPDVRKSFYSGRVHHTRCGEISF